MNEYTRRRVLQAASLTITGSFAGCQGDFPRGRLLVMENVEVEHQDTTWKVNVTVENHNVAQNPSANFHNVSVLGYSADRTLVCQKDIGTISYENDNNNGKRVTLACQERPTVLTFRADESPCSEEFSLGIAAYNETIDSWRLGRYFRKCEEGLPPEPRE